MDIVQNVLVQLQTHLREPTSPEMFQPKVARIDIVQPQLEVRQVKEVPPEVAPEATVESIQAELVSIKTPI